ncbi:hypothetical protein [Clostridium sp. LP20]|uniref:hypothetical protein n=1 Tax=Clostridium sp. LP20 TaxID=3418665 RepID=UPI003EE59274
MISINSNKFEERLDVDICQHCDTEVNLRFVNDVTRANILLEPIMLDQVLDTILDYKYKHDSSYYENELLRKDAEIEELKNIIEQYEENNEAYREKLITSCGPF